jgi:hypothetical protein
MLEGDFVVFLIGMRINQPLAVHKWLPTIRSMPPMIRELYARPELGFLGTETWFGRTILLVQYWRSAEHLMAYATNRDAAHLPAWRAFNRRVGTDGSVGIFHETYRVAAGGYETVYVNMPPFGLGKAGAVVPAVGRRERAADRLSGLSKPD